MKYNDLNDGNMYTAQYEFGDDKFASIRRTGEELWHLDIKGQRVLLEMDEMLGLQTLMTKAIMKEKQTP